MHEKLATAHKPHYEEDLLFGHEDVAHANQEWMVSLQQDIFFQLGGSDLIIVKNHIFAQTLHSVHFLCVFLLDQKNLAEAASADYFDDREVLKGSVGISTLGKLGFVTAALRYFVFVFACLKVLLRRWRLFYRLNWFVNILIVKTTGCRGYSFNFILHVFFRGGKFL